MARLGFSLVFIAIVIDFGGLYQPCNAMTSTNNRSNRWLVLDFDGTCTKRDTISLLPELAARYTGDSGRERETRLAAFAAIEDDYFKLYERAKEAVMQERSDDMNSNLGNALDSIDDASNKVIQSVTESKCLMGLPQDGIRMRSLIDNHTDLQEELRLQDYCVSSIVKAHCAGWNLGVLSINWCRPLIEAVLLDPIRESLAKEENDTNERPLDMEVWCNEVDQNGAVTINFPGALAKKASIADLKQRQQQKSPSSSPFIIYVGDSSTDLLGILEADVGILIGHSSSAVAIAKKFGVRVAPLSERQINNHFDNTLDKNTVWKTETWTEIGRLLDEFGDDHKETTTGEVPLVSETE